jgi:hypothetical protein
MPHATINSGTSDCNVWIAELTIESTAVSRAANRVTCRVPRLACPPENEQNQGRESRVVALAAIRRHGVFGVAARAVDAPP